MATERPRSERFEDVDWEEVSRQGGLPVTPRTAGLLATLGAMTVLFLYDVFMVDPYTPTFAAVGWEYDVSQLDWLFALTLVMLFFYAVIPMYQNPRMTRYYWRNFKKNRAAVISLVYLLVIFVVGLLGPLFLKQPEIALFQKYQPPIGLTVDSSVPIQCVGEVSNGQCHGTWKYPFGTTGQGKDILTIIVYGMQVSMKIGLITSLLVMTIGSIVGTVAAYAGGLVDELLMRYVDIQMVFPSFLLYLLMVYMFGGSLFTFILIFGGLTWGNNARYVRSNALQKTEEEYIKAAKTSGANTWYVIRRHLIPNTASSIITDLTLLIPVFILAEAQLAFLGLGDSSVPSWGQIIAAGRGDLSTAWWITTIPGFFLFFTILAFNFLGDALLDALNPQADSKSDT
ncbi:MULTISPECIES: ABC transporter permease [Halorussus]|uniref:ABC transporter permease n=1 Tax=Halorussus TaxID=1070314 RepID=UPI00209F6E62|nr:ABC transporter permease [Halorussus vallis]USZ75552.1 ABC transporter permease [Halorussus vallis]